MLKKLIKKYHRLRFAKRIANVDVSPKEAIQIFEYSNPEELLYTHIKTNGYMQILTDDVQLKMLDLANAVELVNLYCNRYGHILCDAAQIKMLNHPMVADFVRAYTAQNSLCDKAQLLLFKFSNEKFATHYFCHKYLCDKAQIKVLDLPDAETIVFRRVGNRFSFCCEAQIKILETPFAKKFIYQYLDYSPLCNDTILKILELPIAESVMDNLLFRDEDLFYDKYVQLKMVESPNLYEYLRKYCGIGTLCNEAQIRMLQHPHAEYLLATYCHHNPLCEKAQREMLRYPYAKKIAKMYTSKHPLCKEVTDALWVD